MNETIKLGLTLMLISLAAGGALAITNYSTTKQIELQKELALKESLNKVIKAESFQEKGSYYNAYAQDGNLIGRVLKITAPGYSSLISAVVGIDLENKITGIDIVSQQETPGLGAKITEEDFLGQFIGKGKESLKVKKDSGEIDAVTGATISSRAVTNSIRDAIEKHSAKENETG